MSGELVLALQGRAIMQPRIPGRFAISECIVSFAGLARIELDVKVIARSAFDCVVTRTAA